MKKRMLIDATHAEETRVAVVDGIRLVDFDYESQFRKQLKGSIFLAKVTRVEPSLQAAFVNFGGNRHGFLPFSEIHPDYFRIPIADREALIAAQQAELEERRAEEEAADREEEEAARHEGRTHLSSDEEPEAASGDDEGEEESVEEIGGAYAGATEAEDDSLPENGEDRESGVDADDEDRGNKREEETEGGEGQGHEKGGRRGGRGGRNFGRGRGRGGGRGGRRGSMPANSRRVEMLGGDGVEGDSAARSTFRRNYKIQEVVKRGQIMLVQASREERGNKGAAVTTYLSLPGRYCVLMPNSQRAGGVSRKIASFAERRRMREILDDLKVPDGMSVIMRTAGVARTKPEIKRDLDYLTRLWDTIRELTLKSTAPAVIHEEGQLIRRAIRDIYGRDIEEVLVAGEEGFRLARDYMKMMIPSHVKKVVQYTDEQIPLFHRHQVESQISAMGDPSVTLRSGGYIVINPTEALVSIDVNSGRATRERHIEETALKTNLEAADEVARQLRLRDLGGLIVVDFIDMEDRRNNRKVENRLREALSSDRARIQMGRISNFGLLELSRQRLNPSLTEAQFEKCAHCAGIGYVRTVDSAAITALRALEEEGIKARAGEIILHLANGVAIYILNNKRAMLADIERRYGFAVLIRVDDALAPSGYRIEPVKGSAQSAGSSGDDEGRAEPQRENRPVSVRYEESDGEIAEENESEHESGGGSPERSHRPHAEHGRDDGQGDKRGGRRRGRRGGRRRGRRDGGDFSGHRPEGRQHHAPRTHDSGHFPAEESGFSESRGSDTEQPAYAVQPETFRPSSFEETASVSVEQNNGYRPSRPARSEPVSVNEAPPPPRDYETVNREPETKKKGWWNRLTE